MRFRQITSPKPSFPRNSVLFKLQMGNCQLGQQTFVAANLNNSLLQQWVIAAGESSPPGWEVSYQHLLLQDQGQKLYSLLCFGNLLFPICHFLGFGNLTKPSFFLSCPLCFHSTVRLENQSTGLVWFGLVWFGGDKGGNKVSEICSYQ